jgi:hypothetical protein
MNPGSSPKGIISRHSTDKITDILRDRFPSWPPRSTLPSPIEPESFLVPADDGLWLDKDQRFSPILPKSYKYDPEEPISILEARSLNISFQDIELIPEREAFQGKRMVRPQR